MNCMDNLLHPLYITFSDANQKYITNIQKNMGSKSYSSEITGNSLPSIIQRFNPNNSTTTTETLLRHCVI